MSRAKLSLAMATGILAATALAGCVAEPEHPYGAGYDYRTRSSYSSEPYVQEPYTYESPAPPGYYYYPGD